MGANETRLKLREDLLVEEVSGDWIVFDLEGGHYMGLNETGWLLWQRLQHGPAKVKELGAVLLAEYEIEPDQAVGDAREFADHLVEANLASWVEAE